MNEPSTDWVAALIRAGGRRADPPVEAYRAVLAATESRLRAKVQRRRWRRAGAWLAVAATVAALAVGVGPLLRTPAPSALQVVARVDRVEGSAEWRRAGAGNWTVLAAPSTSLERGLTVRTGTGAGLGLLYPDETSLRLGPDTSIELTGAWSITLHHGTVYLATATVAAREAGRLEVLTPRGSVRHLGTQLEVRYEASSLRVRVREGSVAVANPGIRVVARAGEEVSLGPSGMLHRRVFARGDPAWHWAERLAPMPRFDDRPARVLLEWAAREMGRQLVFAGTAVERHASTVILHGEPGPLAPAEALAVMLATTDLTAEVSGDATIRVMAD
jgi:ferric-dicitrate binding protein FerR (iron transport regulator)